MVLIVKPGNILFLECWHVFVLFSPCSCFACTSLHCDLLLLFFLFFSLPEKSRKGLRREGEHIGKCLTMHTRTNTAHTHTHSHVHVHTCWRWEGVFYEEQEEGKPIPVFVIIVVIVLDSFFSSFPLGPDRGRKVERDFGSGCFLRMEMEGVKMELVILFVLVFFFFNSPSFF